jgi:hypothetical protein
VSARAVSLILPVGAETRALRPALDSARAQSVAAEIVAVVTSEQRKTARRIGPEIDVLVDIAAADWTPGRALNAGCSVATAPIHATVAPGRELPRADWVERLLNHLRRDNVAAASGARRDRAQRLLLEPQDVRAGEWSETFSFSTSAGGWRATAWAGCRFPETVAGAEDRIWAWEILRTGAVLVVDPFLQLEGEPIHPPRAWAIFRRTADDWEGLVSAGAPVAAPSFGEAVRAWWNEVDDGSATPAALQRLNYFHLARALGRWAGGRRAVHVRRSR